MSHTLASTWPAYHYTAEVRRIIDGLSQFWVCPVPSVVTGPTKPANQKRLRVIRMRTRDHSVRRTAFFASRRLHNVTSTHSSTHCIFCAVHHAGSFWISVIPRTILFLNHILLFNPALPTQFCNTSTILRIPLGLIETILRRVTSGIGLLTLAVFANANIPVDATGSAKEFREWLYLEAAATLFLHSGLLSWVPRLGVFTAPPGLSLSQLYPIGVERGRK